MEEKEIEIKLHTIATYNNEEYELQDLCNGLLEQIYNKDKEIERLNNNWNELIKWIVYNKHNENTKERYLVVDFGTLLGKMRELKGEDK